MVRPVPTDRVIHKTSLATDDIREQADYYRQKVGLAAALRFVDNAERAFEQTRPNAENRRPAWTGRTPI
jgi:plasmid stabilization system protein ParE